MENPNAGEYVEFTSPCPFCGGTRIYWDSVLIDQEEQHFLVCRGCGCEGPVNELTGLALALWERRV